MTANVIPFPRPVANLDDARTDPVPVTQTAADMFTAGKFPVKGDYVFTVKYDEDDGGFTLATPGHGRVRESIINAEKQFITLKFDFGLHVTVRGGVAVKWYPDPAKDTA